LLVNHVVVHCYQDLKTAFDRPPQKRPIFNSSPSEQGDRFDLMPWQVPFQTPVEILVQKNAHSGRRKRMGLGLFQQRDNLLPFHTRKSIEKNLNGVPGLEMVEKTPYRHASSLENRLPAQYLRVLHDNVAHTKNVDSILPFGEFNPAIFR
jgi:hypothetical protein